MVLGRRAGDRPLPDAGHLLLAERGCLRVSERDGVGFRICLGFAYPEHFAVLEHLTDNMRVDVGFLAAIGHPERVGPADRQYVPEPHADACALSCSH